MNHEIRNTSEFTPDFSFLAFLSGEIQSTKYYVRIYQPFLCKTNPILSAVGGLQMNVNIFSKMAYKNFIPLAGQKNKPNSKPFQNRS